MIGGDNQTKLVQKYKQLKLSNNHNNWHLPLNFKFLHIRIVANLKQGARNLEEQGIQGPAQQLHQAHRKVTSILATVTSFFILVDPGAIWLFMDPLLSASPVLIHVYTCTL